MSSTSPGALGEASEGESTLGVFGFRSQLVCDSLWRDNLHVSLQNQTFLRGEHLRIFHPRFLKLSSILANGFLSGFKNSTFCQAVLK